VLVLCFALVLFLVSAIAQLWWSLFCIYVLFIFGRWKLKKKRIDASNQQTQVGVKDVATLALSGNVEE